MKKFNKLKILFFLITFFSAAAYAQNSFPFKVKLINLKDLQKSRLYRDSIFIEGNITPPPAKLLVNGVSAPINSLGAFIAYSPVIVKANQDSAQFKTGLIILKIFSNNKWYSLEKKFYFIPPVKSSGLNKFQLDSLFEITPKGRAVFTRGEIIKIKFKATPGGRGYFTLSGLKKKFPIKENFMVNNYYWGEAVFGSGFNARGDTIKGIYTGACRIFKQIDSSIITVHLRYNNISDTNFTLPSSISVLPDNIPTVVLTKKDPNFITARYGPKLGYKLFLQDSIKLLANGHYGKWIRSKLSSGVSIYLPDASVDTLKPGTLPPSAKIQLIRAEETKNFLDVKFGFTERVPVEIHENISPTKLTLFFYNTLANIDWVYYGDNLKFIKEIKHSEIKDGILKVAISLNMKTLWGYSANYEGNVLVLKIKKPLRLNPSFLFWNNQLKNRRIVLDPGHNPGTGAVGPNGLEERKINYLLALELKNALEKEGAKVFLTRPQITSLLPLRKRRAKVVSFNPDVSISLHNNAVPQGVNPITHNGYSVYYYYAQALPLAKLIYNEFRKNLPLNNFGFYWDNLYMCRITEAPAILIEPSFIIMPAQEQLLKTPEFREKIINSIIKGLEKFFEEYAE